MERIFMAKNKNEDNFQEYLKNFNRKNLPLPSQDIRPEEEYIIEALKEGNRLLEDEEKLAAKKSSKKSSVKDDKKNLDDALGLKSTNPYIRARAMWMSNPKNYWKVNDIKKMEIGELPRDQFYDEYAAEIAEMGDKLDEEKKDKSKS
jgi:hypothetical protein